MSCSSTSARPPAPEIPRTPPRRSCRPRSGRIPTRSIRLLGLDTLRAGSRRGRTDTAQQTPLPPDARPALGWLRIALPATDRSPESWVQPNFGPNLSEGSASFIAMAMTDSPSAATPSAPSVLSVVGSARPDEALSVDELGSQIVALAGRLAAATCRWLLLVAQFDTREG